MVISKFVASQAMRGLILPVLFTVTHCSTPEKKETLHPLDSSMLQSRPGSSSSFRYWPEMRLRAGKDEFDLDPDVVISDNVDEVKEILLHIKLSDESRRDKATVWNSWLFGANVK